MSRFPKDRFDVAPYRGERVGAHRSASAEPRGWLTVVISLAAILVLVGAGFVAVRIGDGISGLDGIFHPGSSASSTTQPTKTATTPPTPTATIAPDLSIIVLNGTTVPGAAHSVTQALEDGGWKNVQPPLNAQDQDVVHTRVYYSAKADEGAALGAAQTLEQTGALAGHHVAVEETKDYAGTGAVIAVVIGTDYTDDAG